MKLGENAKSLLYDINNTNLLSVYETSSGVGTNVLSDSKLILSSSVPSNTVIVGNVQLDTTGTGFDSVTSIRSILGGTLRLGGDVSFEKSYVDQERFQHSRRGFFPEVCKSQKI
jgi:hypothetical protein